MRLGWVTGRVTLDPKLPEMPAGSYLICEAMDVAGLDNPMMQQPREKSMPESLVVYDRLGAGMGDLIAFSEGREASAPFFPDSVPMDAYCAAIIDSVHIEL